MNILRTSIFAMAIVGFPFFSAYAEPMTECALSVTSQSTVTVRHEAVAGYNVVVKNADITPGSSSFVFLLTGVDDQFASFIRLQSDESEPAKLDFDLSGDRDMSLNFWAFQGERRVVTVSAVMPWNRETKDLAPYASFGSSIMSVNGASEKEILLSCGPVGWADKSLKE